MPFKDRERRREYDRKYHIAHREKRRAYHRKYREEHREEIAENKTREIRLHVGHVDYIYLGVSGMTRKQRQKFQQELMNGKTDRPRPT